MRVLRFAALILSLVLLVATSLSLVNRRGDVRTAQVAQVERAAAIARTSVWSSTTRMRQEVAITALAVSRSSVTDDAALAAELVRFAPGSEACVGSTVAGCSGTDLFALDTVSDLAVDSERQATADAGGGAAAASAVDPASNTLLFVRRVTSGERTVTVVLQVPVTELIGPIAKRAIDEVDALVELRVDSARATDLSGAPTDLDGRREITDVFGSIVGDGSIVVTTSVDGTVGFAGGRVQQYALLFAMGTVLLALAGWTLLLERRRLEREATTDQLTQLINRREFERVSAEALDIADRFNTGLCVMVIDLNGFKQINDTLGHQFGDLVLTAAAERFVDAVRDTDVVGRWGGDEFVILLPGLSERTAVRNSAERIWERLAGTPVAGDTSISASIGAAIFPRHGLTLEALMRAADVAMYEAKTTGVSHRIADTLAVRGSFDADSDGATHGTVVTDGYAGPDRRRATAELEALDPPTRGSSRIA